jgi:hypothetical protein
MNEEMRKLTEFYAGIECDDETLRELGLTRRSEVNEEELRDLGFLPLKEFYRGLKRPHKPDRPGISYADIQTVLRNVPNLLRMQTEDGTWLRLIPDGPLPKGHLGKVLLRAAYKNMLK